MTDLEHLQEIRSNYGNSIIGYRCIDLPTGEAFNRIRREYELINELFEVARHKNMTLSDLAPLREYEWNEAERRRLLSRMKNKNTPRVPLDISVTAPNSVSIFSRRLGCFSLKIPIDCQIGQGFLVRAGNHKPQQSFYFAYSARRAKRSRAITCNLVQGDAVRFSEVQGSKQNTQYRQAV